MSKTLGQINYERFTPEWVTPLVPWHEVPAQEQQRWEAAAQAVVDAQRTRLELLVKKWRAEVDSDDYLDGPIGQWTLERCAEELDALNKAEEEP